MFITKPGYTIYSEIDYDKMLKFIEKCGRECYQSSHKIEDGSAERFVKMLVTSGHESVIEHEKLTIHFVIDRGVTHEIVRHRHTSPSQESTRYCNYMKEQFGNEIQVVDIRGGIEIDRKMKDLSIHLKNEIYNEWKSAIIDAEKHYFKMLHLGASPQIARSVLPNSLKSGIVITANLREWRLIFKQRTPIAAHPQMREVMIPLLKDLQAQLPAIFDDIQL